MRSRTWLALALCAALLGSGPAVAEERPAAGNGSAERDAGAGKDPVQCKRIRVTGSHFKQRVCQRASAWEELRRQSQQTMRDLTNAPQGASSNN